jgi:hypothetical protein
VIKIQPGTAVRVLDENGAPGQPRPEWPGEVTEVFGADVRVAYAGDSDVFHDGRRGSRYFTTEPRTPSKAERASQAARDGEVFVPCRYGDRVSSCYHVPRCMTEIPGYGRYEPGLLPGERRAANGVIIGSGAEPGIPRFGRDETDNDYPVGA